MQHSTPSFICHYKINSPSVLITEEEGSESEESESEDNSSSNESEEEIGKVILF